MIFIKYLRIYGTKNTPVGPTTLPRGWRARPLPRGPTMALLHLSFHPYTSSSSPKHKYPVQDRFAAFFDLLAQSTSHKTAWGDCSFVCGSSIGPISFCSSALFITKSLLCPQHTQYNGKLYRCTSSTKRW